MLLDFSVENFGPFRDRVTLSMQATSIKKHDENVIDCSPAGMNLVSSALVFGPNASGKSYLFKAICALRSMVDDTFPDGKKYRWYEPFRFDSRFVESPVAFQIRFCEEGTIYDYSISFLSDRVVSERLAYHPIKRARLVFERKESIEDFKGKNKRLLRLLTPTSSFLALGSKYNDELCSKVRGMIRGLITLDSEDVGSLSLRSCKFVEKDDRMRRMMIEGLQKADFGITGYDIIDNSLDIDAAKRILPPATYDAVFPDGRTSVNLHSISVRHRFGRLAGDEGVEASFDMYDEESVGTRYMFGIMGPLVDCLINGKTIFIDEFGSHLHPLLTRWLVEQFSKGNNPHGAQMVAMTHDVGLMDTRDLVRRDQIFLIDKNKDDGSSSLYCLSDFKNARKDDEILRAYLLGRYDAIPLVSYKGVMDVEEDRESFFEQPY